MKQIVTCLLLACSVASQAQITRFSGKSALEEITADKFLAAGNMTDYDRLACTALTPSPKGYEPYYLSHYGRHGARYLLDENDYAMPVKILLQAKFAGKLTPLGDRVLAKLDSMQNTTKNRLGDLENSFRSYYLIPTACNVQFIFYRPKKGKQGDVLVKVLMNEREAHMPMATDMWPYYKWKDVREYYMKKLDEQTNKKK